MQNQLRRHVLHNRYQTHTLASSMNIAWKGSYGKLLLKLWVPISGHLSQIHNQVEISQTFMEFDRF